jgi:hypothetical protein
MIVLLGRLNDLNRSAVCRVLRQIGDFFSDLEKATALEAPGAVFERRAATLVFPRIALCAWFMLIASLPSHRLEQPDELFE